MEIAKVVGTVVPNKTAEGTNVSRWLVVETCNHRGEQQKEFSIALDLINAGYDELVLLCQGSAARKTVWTTDQPTDLIIVGIIDLISENDKIVYDKKTG